MNEKVTFIKPKTGLFEVDLKELYDYRDLIILFVKRNFSAQYKQTILGPMWFILNPLITTFLYTLVFGNIAGLSTDNVPQFAFYLCSNTIWTYFATCLNQTSNTFTSNAAIMGKVYFPRLVVPISTVIYSLISFSIVFFMSAVVNLTYCFTGKINFPNLWIISVPLLVLQTAMLGLGMGIIISSLTTKYRDLQVLVSFGVSLWMYITPVVYTVEQIPARWKQILMLNPMSPIMNNYRYALLGSGQVELKYWLYSWITTIVVLFIGVLLFNKVEKTFMDTV